jgi:lipid II:glycine glycyltransferase (peptidoglycan interpeptide bridge formation enzyme)
MKIIKNLDVKRDKWLNILKKSPFASPFQSPESYDLFNSTENYSADVFAIEDAGEYKALIVVTIQKEKGIKKYFSLRGIVYGGPVLINAELEILKILLENIKMNYRKKLIYLEIRNHFDYGHVSDIFNEVGWNLEPHLNVQLKTLDMDLENVLSRMKYNRRREIRQSYEQNVTCRIADNENEVEQLYNILKELYMTRVKLPLSPYSFFYNLYKSQIGAVFVVMHDEKVIGGAFCIKRDAMSIYTLYYAGIRGYHKKIFPTHVAIVEVIKYAINNQLKMVDFMGAGKPGEEYGVRNYKLQFGGDLVNYGRFNNIFNPYFYNLGIWAIKRGIT